MPRLTEVPPAVFQLTSLERLYLGNNRLTSIAPRVAALERLAVVEAYNNGFVRLRGHGSRSTMRHINR